MKKALIVLLTFISLPLVAIDWQCGWDAEVRVAAFRPTSRRFREIYGQWGAEFQVEASKLICGPYYGWFNVGWYPKDGHSIGLHDKTRIDLVPIRFGAKYMFCLTPKLNGYVGLGATLTYLSIHDHSHTIRHTTRWGAGGIVKTGLRYAIMQCLFVDLFADYSYEPFSFNSKHHIKRKDADVGGLMLGAGLGYSF